MCYAKSAQGYCINGRRLALSDLEGQNFFYPSEKGGCHMVTYMELFTFCLVIIGVVDIVIDIYRNKKK